MIYVDCVYRNIFGKWMQVTKEFTNKQQALRGMYALRSKGFIIDCYRCDDPMDTEWLTHRFKL